MEPRFEDKFNCTFGWSLKAKPHVWVITGPDTDLGRAILALDLVERRELAYQMYSVIKRGETFVFIRGQKFVICRDSFFVPTEEHMPRAA